VLPSIKRAGKKIVKTTENVDLLGREHPDEHGGEHDDADPHTWISPYVAMQQAEAIYTAFVAADDENEANYTRNWNALRSRLDALDRAFARHLANKTVDDIFVTHAAFGYLAHRYGFHQHGVIGASADEQPGTATIATLVAMMMELDIYVIYVDPLYTDEYARALKNTLEEQTGTSVTLLHLNLMLGPKDGMDYFAQQEENLENLKIGLGVP
jgi:zinc transport system substrate-binding protein